jgi:hypothetical protein
MNRPLVLACGALVAELRAVLDADGLADAVDVHYLPANLHNRPDGIVPALEEMLAQHDPDGIRPVLVAYADCGTGGGLDRLVERRPNLRRLPGSHCYEFFAGSATFARLHDEQPGTFYLTDFLAKHFDALVWQGLGLDRHPQLRDAYFGHYTRVVLLSQADGSSLDTVVAAGERAAQLLGLEFEHHPVGLHQFRAAIGKVA